MPGLIWANQFAVTPDQGGGTRHFELCSQLTKLGWRTVVLASDFNLHRRQYVRRGSPVHRLPVDELVGSVHFRWLWCAPYQRNNWRRFANWLTFALGVAGQHRQGDRFDVVIGSSPQPLAALGAWVLARNLRVPFVLEIRDIWPESLQAASGRRGPLFWILQLIVDFLYRQAELFVVLAEGTREHLRARGVTPERICFAPNGVDQSAFVARRGVGEASDRCKLVYAGAHGPANGLDTLLNAAAILRGSTVQIVLVGDGPSKSALRARAEELKLDNVMFHDPVPKSEMPALLAEADGGLMILRDAPLFHTAVSPNKLYDYFAAELPVVNNVAGHVAETLRLAGGGIQAADASAEALAEAITRFARLRAEERLTMGRSASSWVRAHRNRESIAVNIDVALRELIVPVSGDPR